MFPKPLHATLLALQILGLFEGCEAGKKTAKKMGKNVGKNVGKNIIAPLIVGGIVSQLSGGGGRLKGKRRNILPGDDTGSGERDVDVRDDPWSAPPGVPQYNFDMCADDLAKTTITVHGPVSNHGVRIENLPPTCMVLSTVVDGDANGGPTPIPCGNACLLYDNLNSADYEEMRQIFLDYPGHG